MQDYSKPIMLVSCPKCQFIGREEDFEVAIKQDDLNTPVPIRLIGVGFRCRKCGTEFGFGMDIEKKD